MKIKYSSFLEGLEAPVKRCCIELLKYVDAAETLSEFRKWTETMNKFTVRGLELLDAGIPKGPSVKNTLKYLHKLWVEVGFKFTKRY